MTTETATGQREYKLAADVTVTNYGQLRRDILEFADGERRVVVSVLSDDAMDVLEALRRAYRAGREDRAAACGSPGSSEPVRDRP